MEGLQSPAQATYWFIQGYVLFAIFKVLGLGAFAFIVWKRLVPLMRAAADVRFDRPWAMLRTLLQFWLAQWKHPRYWFAGVVHVLVFAGFLG